MKEEIKSKTQLKRYLDRNWGKIKHLSEEEMIKKIKGDNVTIDIEEVKKMGKILDDRRSMFREARQKPIQSVCPLCGIEHRSKKGKRAYCYTCSYKIKRSNGYVR